MKQGRGAELGLASGRAVRTAARPGSIFGSSSRPGVCVRLHLRPQAAQVAVVGRVNAVPDPIGPLRPASRSSTLLLKGLSWLWCHSPPDPGH